MTNFFSLVSAGADSLGIYPQHTTHFNDLVESIGKTKSVQQSSFSMLGRAFGRVSHHLQESIKVANGYYKGKACGNNSCTSRFPLK
ncbi:MAG: hypothetical protein LBU89_10835 [Fibromonadaceae bacterium]|jgi:hypothetical protein|nr:hypothetical protein [Fibromonadaceae bacterium]